MLICSLAVILLVAVFNLVNSQEILVSQWLLNNGFSTNAAQVVIKNRNIESIDPNAFNGYGSTFTLNLANNRLAQLDAGLFDGMRRLGVFDVSFNRIRSVDPGLFRNLAQLVTINLEMNELTTLDEQIFSGLVNLRNLFLTRNRLTRISANLLNSRDYFFFFLGVFIFVVVNSFILSIKVWAT